MRLESDDIVVSCHFALQLQLGDTISLYDDEDVLHEGKIEEIVPARILMVRSKGLPIYVICFDDPPTPILEVSNASQTHRGA